MVQESNKKINLITRLQFHIEEFISLSERAALRFKFWNGLVWDKDNEIHMGQKIRYGGINTFRGYQEDIFASDIINIISLDVILSPNEQFQMFPLVIRQFRPFPCLWASVFDSARLILLWK